MGLYKRGSVWWMSFVYSGKQYQKTTKTENKKQAQRIYDKIKYEIAEGIWFDRLPGEEKTFREMMEKFETEHVSQKRAVRTVKGHIKNLNLFFGDCIVSKITPAMINEFKNKKRKEGASNSTINRYLATLKKAFNLAVREWEWVRENLVLRVSMEKEPPGRVRYLSEEEFQRLCDACSEWLKSIVLTAYHTGMRKENILSLKWGQVDLFRKVITLEHTKNDERHGIPINNTLMETFLSLSKVRHLHSSYVFCHKNGERFYEIKRGFKKALREAGIEDFRFHDLRHCFASSLVQKGVDPYQVQRLLGHKSQAMTQRYAHLAPENLRSAVLKLDENFYDKSMTIQKNGVKPLA
jgi:integrase